MHSSRLAFRPTIVPHSKAGILQYLRRSLARKGSRIAGRVGNWWHPMILERDHDLMCGTPGDERVDCIRALRDQYRIAKAARRNAGVTEAVDGANLSPFEKQNHGIFVFGRHWA